MDVNYGDQSIQNIGNCSYYEIHKEIDNGEYEFIYK